MRTHTIIIVICMFASAFIQSCYKCDDYMNMTFDCLPDFKQVDTNQNLTSISFGSCASQDEAQPILTDALNMQPDLFIYLGDNVYIDSKQCSDFFSVYSKLACKPEFKNLVGNIPTIAVWDDHDYGWNDAGKEYRLKEESKDIFLRFWNEPLQSERFNHTGIYHSLYFGDDAHRVQVILLDTRTFRSDLKGLGSRYKQDYSPDKTFLGNQQWSWLEQELSKPAKIRIIASSTQFSTEHNGWEAWANFPVEQIKMGKIISRTQANGVVFISGDVHYAELSKLPLPDCYPIYDFTSSGITSIEKDTRANKYRIGNPYTDYHYSNLKINWESTPVLLTYTVYGINNQNKFEHTISLDELKF